MDFVKTIEFIRKIEVHKDPREKEIYQKRKIDSCNFAFSKLKELRYFLNVPSVVRFTDTILSTAIFVSVSSKLLLFNLFFFRYTIDNKEFGKLFGVVLEAYLFAMGDSELAIWAVAEETINKMIRVLFYFVLLICFIFS